MSFENQEYGDSALFFITKTFKPHFHLVLFDIQPKVLLKQSFYSAIDKISLIVSDYVPDYQLICKQLYYSK